MHFNDIVDSVRNLGPGLDLILDILGQRFNVARGSKVDVTITNPQEMLLSVYHDLTRDLAVMGNFGWQNWKSFGNPNVTIRGGNTIETTADLHFSNTYHFSISAMSRIAPASPLPAGFTFDTSTGGEVNLA